MRRVASLLDYFTQMWCNLVALVGGLITLGAVALCLAPGDYLMSIIVFVALLCFFTGAAVGPRILGSAIVRKLTTKTIYHHMDDGTILIEEQRL